MNEQSPNRGMKVRGRSSRPLCIAVLTMAVGMVSCAAPARTYFIDEPDPYAIDLSEGTAWVYWLIDQNETAGQSAPLDTLITWVELEVYHPGSRILIDPLLNITRLSAYEQYRHDPVSLIGHLRDGPVLLPSGSFHLPAEGWFDSTGFIEHQVVKVIGSVCLIEAIGDSSLGKYPHYMANSTAGLLDLTSWTWSRNEDQPRPVYRPHIRMADLIVPASRSRIGGWNTGKSGWIVTATDTLITVPCGSFSCMEISYYQDSDSPSGPLLEEYREYWTPGIGLVAWIDNREDGDGYWVLAEYGTGVSGGTNRTPD
ncbi:hypothetical protein ACFL6T_00405 [Candidatus Zixiibacteriota bacterium]